MITGGFRIPQFNAFRLLPACFALGKEYFAHEKCSAILACPFPWWQLESWDTLTWPNRLCAMAIVT